MKYIAKVVWSLIISGLVCWLRVAMKVDSKGPEPHILYRTYMLQYLSPQPPYYPTRVDINKNHKP